MLSYLKSSLEPIGYKVEIDDEQDIRIWHECMSWIIKLLLKEGGYFMPVFYFRTHFGQGERTDFHEIIPMIAALFFRASGKFSFRFLGQHNAFTDIEDELYGTFMFPSQPLSERIRLKSKSDKEDFAGLLFEIFFIHSNLCNIVDIEQGGEQTYSWDGEEFLRWLEKIKGNWKKKVVCTYNERTNPSWFYFRSFSQGVSVIKSEQISRVIKGIYEANRKQHSFINGVSGKLYISGDIRNSVADARLELASRILESLENNSEKVVIPNENITYVIGDCNIVAITNDGSVSSFLKQKELVKKRNAHENIFLFSERRIEWNITSRADSALFEDLILELLSHEPYILSAKKVSPTNQGDNGRDIICKYNATYSELRVSKEEPSLRVGNLIVQCKTNLKSSQKFSIGKSDVDIADTVYDYQPNAYLLVVNSQVTKDLTEYLEKIQTRQELHWVDWWNSFDVEERLRINPDIMGRYRDIVHYL